MGKPLDIYLSSPHIGDKEKSYVAEAFQTNWIAPLGPHVVNFEKDIENFYGHNFHCAVLSSGTAALHLALLLLGVGPGDEVICQSFTFAASANPIAYLGAKPIFIDSERTTWNLCPELLENAIKESIIKNKPPKAIIAVDLYGMPYQIDKVKSISEKYGIPIIEDSAEALGSKWNGKKSGSFGDISILSFNGNKIITTSGGGALVSKNQDFTKKAVFLATQARDNAPHYQHSNIGYNYRMSNVLAGIGRGQMEVLENRVESRRSNHEFYLSKLSQCKNISFLIEPNGFYSNRWLSCILTDSYETREKIRFALLEKAIESRPLWKPLHLQPIFKHYTKFENGVSQDLFNRGLCLPSSSNLTEEQLNRISETIIKVYQNDKGLCIR